MRVPPVVWKWWTAYRLYRHERAVKVMTARLRNPTTWVRPIFFQPGVSVWVTSHGPHLRLRHRMIGDFIAVECLQLRVLLKIRGIY